MFFGGFSKLGVPLWSPHFRLWKRRPCKSKSSRYEGPFKTFSDFVPSTRGRLNAELGQLALRQVDAGHRGQSVWASDDKGP